MKIAYEPHPVTPERKAELRGQGFKIIDARFAPEVEASDQSAPIDIDGMKKAELVDLLEMHGADTQGKVAELRDRLTAIMFVDL